MNLYQPVDIALLFERYNENHDPDNGEFADGDGGSGSGSSKSSSSSSPKKADDAHSDKAVESAVNWYQENGYKTINNALRGGGKLPERVQKSVTALDAAIKKHTEAKALTVYRGIKGKKLNVAAFTSGKTITLKGYASTTANTKVADLFAVVNSDKASSPIRFEISVPKGAHTLRTEDAVKNARSATEKEVILPRDSKFEVVAIKETKAFNGNKITVIHLDLIT